MIKFIFSLTFISVYLVSTVLILLWWAGVLPTVVGHNSIGIASAVIISNALVHSLYVLGIDTALLQSNLSKAEQRDPDENFSRLRNKSHFERMKIIKKSVSGIAA